MQDVVPMSKMLETDGLKHGVDQNDEKDECVVGNAEQQPLYRPGSRMPDGEQGVWRHSDGPHRDGGKKEGQKRCLVENVACDVP